MKKVLIITGDKDLEAANVIDWLHYYDIPYYRLNGEEFLEKKIKVTIRSEEQTLGLKVDGQSFESFTSVWFRKNGVSNYDINSAEITSCKLNKEFNMYLRDEYRVINKKIYDLLASGKKMLGRNFYSYYTKLTILDYAKEAGLIIPETLITNNKNDLHEFLKRHKKIITKSLYESGRFKLDVQTNSNAEIFGYNFTEVLTSKDLSGISETFFPSLFQRAILKENEIRTFFLDGECYSMAIFSQSNESTKTDFRMHGGKTSNRYIPFKLPEKITDKIVRLMKMLDLNTGSLDFIHSEEGEFIFLEVNPSGIYDMTSTPCNYHLNEKIAKYLI